MSNKTVQLTDCVSEPIVIIHGEPTKESYRPIVASSLCIGKTIEAIGIGRYETTKYDKWDNFRFVYDYIKVIMFTDGTADSFDMTYDEAQAMDLEKLFGEIDNENEIRD